VLSFFNFKLLISIYWVLTSSSGKCQIIHWRQGHKDECREPQIQTDNKPNSPASAPPRSSNSKADSSGKSEEPDTSRSTEKVTKTTPLAETETFPSTINADSKVKRVPNETDVGNKSGLKVPGNKETAVYAKDPHTATMNPDIGVVPPPSRLPEEKILANNKEKTDSPVKSASTSPPMIPNSGSGTGKRALKSSKSLAKEVTANKMVSARRVNSLMTDSAKKVGEALLMATKSLGNGGDVANGTATSFKNFVKQNSISKITRRYPSDLVCNEFSIFYKNSNSVYNFLTLYYMH
jgi:hypothetical protein